MSHSLTEKKIVYMFHCSLGSSVVEQKPEELCVDGSIPALGMGFKKWQRKKILVYVLSLVEKDIFLQEKSALALKRVVWS